MAFRVFTRKFSAGRQLRALLDEQFTPDKLKAFEKPGKLFVKNVNISLDMFLLFVFLY